MRGLSENLQCKIPYFFTKCWDPLDLSLENNIWICFFAPWRGAYCYALIFFFKVSFEKHPSVHLQVHLLKQSHYHQHCNITTIWSPNSIQSTTIQGSYMCRKFEWGRYVWRKHTVQQTPSLQWCSGLDVAAAECRWARVAGGGWLPH